MRLGGYYPAQKWLIDRKGRSLSTKEIKRYKSIIRALELTSQIMERIDQTLTIHGST
jgi:hypothetical protein